MAVGENPRGRGKRISLPVPRTGIAVQKSNGSASQLPFQLQQLGSWNLGSERLVPLCNFLACIYYGIVGAKASRRPPGTVHAATDITAVEGHRRSSEVDVEQHR